MWSFFLTLACLAVGSLLLLTAAVLIGMSVYALPYLVWFGWNQGTKGIPRNPPSKTLSGKVYLRHSVQNATKLYRSWFTHTPHNITDW